MDCISVLMLQDGQEVVKTGTFLYDGRITCDVVIVRGPICYGSGDSEDFPEYADDHEQETFYIITEVQLSVADIMLVTAVILHC